MAFSDYQIRLLAEKAAVLKEALLTSSQPGAISLHGWIRNELDEAIQMKLLEPVDELAGLVYVWRGGVTGKLEILYLQFHSLILSSMSEEDIDRYVMDKYKKYLD